MGMFAAENAMLATVASVAHSLVYEGLEEQVALALIMALTEEESKVLNAVLIKMLSAYNGRRL